MKKLPDKKELDIMWSVATSSAIEVGIKPHILFASLLVNEINGIKPPVELAEKKNSGSQLDFDTNHMTNQHPITPPTELVSKWIDLLASRSEEDVLIFATQWGADQELEACCEWLDERTVLNGSTALRIARRPNSPSLKEQALEILEINNDVDSQLSAVHYNIIRRALEALPND